MADISKDVKNRLVSVIMPAYNEEKYIERAMKSIIDQTYGNWELIVIDDASMDRTVEIIESYAARDARIKLHKSKRNRGACAALNKALDLAEGEYICWLSADDKYKPDMMESCICFLQEHEELQAVFGRHEFIDAEDSFIRSWQPDEEFLNIGKKECAEPYYTLICRGNAFNACAVFATAAAFRAAGYFDEAHPYAGDYDYMLRLTAYADIGYMNKVIVESRIHGEQVSCEGKNNGDAISAYIGMLSKDDIRSRLFKKAGIREGKKEILGTLNNRWNICMNLNQAKEAAEVGMGINWFLMEFPLIKRADEYCGRLGQMINLQQWGDAEKAFLAIPEEIRLFVNEDTWGIYGAAILENRGEYRQEKETLEQVLEINQSNYEAHYMLGRCFEREEREIPALEHYMEAVKCCKENSEDREVLIDNLKRYMNERF